MIQRLVLPRIKRSASCADDFTRVFKWLVSQSSCQLSLPLPPPIVKLLVLCSISAIMSDSGKLRVNATLLDHELI
jgi:hypothetical protein